MPYNLRFSLNLAHTKPLPENCIPALHRCAYHWLELADPLFAKHVHDHDSPKPLTVSPLYDTSARTSRRDGDPSAEFNITLLEDDVYPFLQRGILAEPWVDIIGNKLPLGGATDRIADEGRLPYHSQHKSYAQLCQRPRLDRQITLHFSTPTHFRTRGLQHRLPDPTYVFGSYLDRWNAYAPFEMRIPPEWLIWLSEWVEVAAFELHDDGIYFADKTGGYTHIGFVGWVRYQVAERRDKKPPNTVTTPEALAIFNALADYAQYCGTGHKTTQGMGRTHRS